MLPYTVTLHMQIGAEGAAIAATALKRGIHSKQAWGIFPLQ